MPGYFCTVFNMGPGTFRLESLGPGVLIQKFRLRDAALWDFQFLSESSHFQDDRSLRDAAVQGLEPRQDTQPPWKKGLQSLHPPGKHRVVGEIHTALHGRWRNRWSRWNCQGNLGRNPIAQVISFAYSCNKFCGTLSTLKWNSALVYGRHTKLPEISESSTHNLTESFLVSLLMINSPGLV